jgi:ABC-2 type transport system ATP-binding protein
MVRTRFRTSARRGVAVVELAVLLPFLLVVLLGIWEVGRLIEVQQILNNAAREGARIKGMVPRLGVAQALVNDPELLVLDEPTEGLDLSGRQLLRSVVRDLKARGRTVLLITHVLTEVEQLCDRVAVLVGGRLKFAGPLAELSRLLEKGLQELYATEE